MRTNGNLIETTERFYRLFQQSKTKLDDSDFIKVQKGIELLPLWGDSQTGTSGVMIRFAPNISQKI